ncbi:MAG: CDP-alcohol phosphatidyltransferase family protein [Thermoplasmatota archaeon]
MVLDNYRSTLDWWLVPLAKLLRRIHPNHITWVSLLCAIAGGIAFWQSGPDQLGWLWLASGMVVANGVLDVLDGKIAVMTGRTSPKGDYLDHAIDRFSDVCFLGGLAFSPWVDLRIGLAAIVFTLLTSYLGTQAQAVGIGRNYGGLLGRADRMVLMMVIPPLQAGLTAAGVTTSWEPWPPSLLEALLAYFAVVGFITTVQRFAGGLRAFDETGQLK